MADIGWETEDIRETQLMVLAGAESALGLSDATPHDIICRHDLDEDQLIAYVTRMAYMATNMYAGAISSLSEATNVSPTELIARIREFIINLEDPTDWEGGA